MSYLMIRNAGIADPSAITLLGVSGTRYNHATGTIGQFGSGSKHSIALLLRYGINPVIVSGNLKMEFFSKPICVNGNNYNQVMVKYSGKDENGATRNYTSDLGFTTEWGIQDWNKLAMAFREFVANAIDGATISGGSYKDVEFEVKDSPRAKAGHTAVFLPLTPDIQTLWNNLPELFLHFKNPAFLNMQCLPKTQASDYVHFYKKGVLVCTEKAKSVFDYNLQELTLDESRNANTWDVRYAVAKALGKGKSTDIAKILLAQLGDEDIWENNLDAHYLYSDYDSESDKAVKTKIFTEAFKTIAGDSGILTQGTKHIVEVIERKGFKPLTVSPSWYTALEKYGCANQNQVLEGLEKDGIPESEATPDMLKAVDEVWNLLSAYDMLNGREKPPVKGFSPLMSGEAQTWGMYKGGCVYLHTSMKMSPMLLKVALEEVVHHVSGCGDRTYDLQDFLFNLIIRLVF